MWSLGCRHVAAKIFCVVARLFPSLQGMFWKDSLKVMNEHASSNVNTMFIQSYLVFNYILKNISTKIFIQRSWNILIPVVFLS